MKYNIYCPDIVINRLHAATSCCKVIKRLEQIHRCYMAKSEFPRFADVTPRAAVYLFLLRNWALRKNHSRVCLIIVSIQTFMSLRTIRELGHQDRSPVETCARKMEEGYTSSQRLARWPWYWNIVRLLGRQPSGCKHVCVNRLSRNGLTGLFINGTWVWTNIDSPTQIQVERLWRYGKH